MRIEEVASTTKAQRVATHTHIKGLGIADDGTAVSLAAGDDFPFSMEGYHNTMAEHGGSMRSVSYCIQRWPCSSELRAHGF